MYCDGDMKIVFLMNFIPLEIIFTLRQKLNGNLLPMYVSYPSLKFEKLV